MNFIHIFFFFFSSRRRHTRYWRDWSSDVCSSDLLSTPWGGHKAAQSGVDTAPAVVEVWYDMVPGSKYQQSVFARPLPPEMQHHMLFTFQRKSGSFGESDDQGVTVASQLALPAQRN